MDLGLQGKSVIVTAASKGLGKATATAFAMEGAHVLISSRNAATLKEAVTNIRKETGNENVDYIVCDMKKAADIKALVEKAVNWNGTVDVLINNAGGPPAGSFLDMNDADWYHAFELNLLSFVRTIREVIPYMQKQQQGHIVNLASSSMKQSLDQLLLSNAIRPGVAGLTKSLAQEFGQDNILINAVGPGTIETDRILELNEIKAQNLGVPVEKLTKEAEHNIPMKRYGKPEEFANAIVFLASSANTYISGQSLLVDGGLVKAL
ncbi:3-oxoacyl-[acyl-carrier protein] reductase [Oceanobacillus limi]|uniref:3-oxoacyl-[acyl-carrier protein] reductase n=1 Tax=Oceanobacillus limi TaxID=930131 RepID=A0A1I0FNW3_9BACI|nr:SDR family oxidoreductase [Oceanobacillus limi]SET60108.1 3-oxoacyl-[acyl-carrier protein] reductase [Oceanobacillus limi]